MWFSTFILIQIYFMLMVPRDAVGPRDHVAPEISPLAPEPAEL